VASSAAAPGFFELPPSKNPFRIPEAPPLKNLSPAEDFSASADLAARANKVADDALSICDASDSGSSDDPIGAAGGTTATADAAEPEESAADAAAGDAAARMLTLLRAM
jgi:hypothetical protein